MGRETARTGLHTPQMAKGIVTSLRKQDVRKLVEEHRRAEAIAEQEVRIAIAHVATQEEMKAFTKLTAKEREALVNAARKIHVNTGHKPPSELARLLRKENAPLASRAAMGQVKCSSCTENSRPPPAPVASLNTATEPWKVIGVDVKEISVGQWKHKFLVIVDEATRLTAVVKLFTMPKSNHRNITTQMLVETLDSHWFVYFGEPSVIRHDPEGAMVSTEFIETMSLRGIRLQASAGEAPWQLGIVERTIQTVFNSAQRIATEQKLEIPDAVRLAVIAHNTTERVHGYSPAQWSFGRNPNWSSTMFPEKEDETNIARDSSEGFQHKLKMQIEARKVYEEESLRQKVQRAARAKHRKDAVYIPGELVYVWRLGVGKLSGTQKTGLHKGSWLGPGVVLGTESRELEGNIYPSAVIWVVINDRLWRCAPEQVRRASEREHADHLLRQHRPWTFEGMTKNLTLGQYRDLTQDPGPEQPYDHEAPDPEDEGQAPQEDEPDADIPMEVDQPQPVQRKRVLQPGEEYAQGNGKRYQRKLPPGGNLEAAQKLAMSAADYVCSTFMSTEEFPEKVIEIAFPLLDSEYKIRKFLRNPESFVVTSVRKRRVEVSEKKLNKEERELMNQAKGKEVKEFIKEQVVQRLKDNELVSESEAMKMRWVLTWKKNEDGSLKGKARLVVLGFQDPHLGSENTSAPTLNRRSKQTLLQVVVERGWKLQKGDVTAAFLQGRTLNKNKYAVAPKELAEAMGLPEGERIIRLVKSVYGLTTAPLEWYSQVDRVLKELGGRQTSADPCVWVFNSKDGAHIGIIGAHVDDFLIAGQDNSEWNQIKETLLAAFR